MTRERDIDKRIIRPRGRIRLNTVKNVLVYRTVTAVNRNQMAY